jgi:hypothetical protein
LRVLPAPARSQRINAPIKEQSVVPTSLTLILILIAVALALVALAFERWRRRRRPA